MRRHQPVLDLFELAKEVEYLFGMSDGVHIMRAVAVHCREKVARLRAPGGTRKVAYLSGVPGSLVDNFGVLLKSLWARVAWAQAGHSAQTIAHLLDVGRRLADPKTLTVMMLAHDIFRGIVRPFALRVQAHLEPANFFKFQELVLSQIRAAQRCLSRLRRILRVISLCRQHVGADDLARLLEAFGTGSLRALYPTFFQHAPRLLGAQRSFQGCKIEVPDDHDSSQRRFLGAHCQCLSVEWSWAAFRREVRERRRAQHQADAARNLVRVPLSRGAARHITVPRWVAAGEDIRPCVGDYIEVEPRCSFRPTGPSAPPPGANARGMFRDRLPRCQVLKENTNIYNAGRRDQQFRIVWAVSGCPGREKCPKLPALSRISANFGAVEFDWEQCWAFFLIKLL